MNVFRKHLWMRKVGMFLLDIVLISVTIYVSMELRFEMQIPYRHAQTMLASVPLVLAVYMGTYLLGGIYRIMWRYAGVHDVARLSLLSGIACGLTLAAIAADGEYENLVDGSRARVCQGQIQSDGRAVIIRITEGN